MSLELNRRVKSTVAMLVVFAGVMGLGAVVQNEALKPFLLEIGLSNSLATLVVVFLYQAVAFILNNLPSKGDSSLAGSSPKSGRSLI